MKKKILIILFAGLPFFQNAQSYKSIYSFKPDFYIGLNTGMNYYISEGFRDYKVTDAVGYQYNGFIGYHFSPLIGVRSSIAYNLYNWPDNRISNNSIQRFNSINTNIDLTVSLNSLFHKLENLNKSEFNVYIGTGLAFRNNLTFNNNYSKLSGRIGLQYNYTLSNHLKLNILGDLNILDDTFNNFDSGVPYEIVQNLSIGFSYHFKEDYYKNMVKYWE